MKLIDLLNKLDEFSEYSQCDISFELLNDDGDIREVLDITSVSVISSFKEDYNSVMLYFN